MLLLRSLKGRFSPYAVVILLGALVLLYRAVGLGLDFFLRASLDDFNHYYASAYLLAKGTIPYGIPFLETALADAFVWSAYTPSATNPPLLLLLTLPLSLFEPHSAWVLWFSIVCAAIVSCALVLMRELGGALGARERLLAMLLFFSSAPVFRMLEHGQIQAVLLACILLGWASARRGLWTRAAVLWAFGAALKLYAWPILFVLLLRSVRLFLFGASLAAIFLALPAALFGFEIYRSFISEAIPLIRIAGAYLDHNMSFVRLVSDVSELFLLREIPWVAQTGLGFFFPLALIAALFRLTSGVLSDVRRIDVLTSSFAAAAFFCSPVAWPNYSLVLFFPAVVLVVYARDKRVSTIVTLLCVLAFWSPIPGALYQLNVDAYYFALRSLFAVMTCYFVSVNTALLMGRRRVRLVAAATPQADRRKPLLLLPPSPAYR